MRRFRSDRSGSVIAIFSFAAMLLAIIVAIVMNQVSLYISKRNLQSAVDMTALMIMDSGNLTTAHARSMIEAQYGHAVVDVKLVTGTYTPDAGLSEAKRFVSGGTPINAIELTASLPGEKVMLAGMMSGTPQLSATARAARRTSASIVVGSRLVRVEGGLSAALLDATLGYKGKLTVMDYESLVSANVDAAQYLRVLNTQANIKAVTFDDVLKSSVSVGQILNAAIGTTSDGKIKTLLAKGAPVSGTDKIKLEKVVDLGSMTTLPIDALLVGDSVPISIGQLLTGSAALADKDHQIAIDLASVLGDSSIANASLDVGEKPQHLDSVARAGKGAEVDTSQFKLNIGALGLSPLTAVKVDVSMANASVEVDDITCKADGSASVKLKAKTELASVGVKASILPRIPVVLGNDETKTLTFSQADIDAQTYKPVRSGLGLQLGGLSVAQKLLFNPVDNLLEKLGLHTAEADVMVSDATCGEVGLVH